MYLKSQCILSLPFPTPCVGSGAAREGGAPHRPETYRGSRGA